jgi:hypothetical protein
MEELRSMYVWFGGGYRGRCLASGSVIIALGFWILDFRSEYRLGRMTLEVPSPSFYLTINIDIKLVIWKKEYSTSIPTQNLPNRQ